MSYHNLTTSSHIRVFAGIVTASGCLLTACGELPTPAPTKRAASLAALSAAAPTRPIRLSEVDARNLAHTVQGYGGTIYDDNNDLVVLVKGGQVNSFLRSEALGMLRRTRRPLKNRRGADIQVRFANVAFGFEELAQWRDTVFDRVWAIPGVTSLDLDEAQNRIIIGRNANTTDATILSLTDQLGVPRSAIGVTVATGVELTQSKNLVQEFRPIVGGIQIGPSGCTAGIPALQDGIQIIITASHCTDVDYEWDGGPFTQPRFGNAINGAAEVSDPGTYFCGSAFYWEHCITADAAAYGVGDASLGLGLIAHPMNARPYDWPEEPNQLVVSDAMPTFHVVGTIETLMVNESVEKVSVTTGWTYGPVRQTCVDRRTNGVKLVCQDLADLNGGPGDSGGPVFRILSSADAQGQQVLFAGILWACDVSCESTHAMLISNTAQIRQRLGNLTFY